MISPLSVIQIIADRDAQIAQLVEQRTENPRVTGSIPVLGIFLWYGILAQSVEHLTFNQGVPRSSRGWITIFFVWMFA